MSTQNTFSARLRSIKRNFTASLSAAWQAWKKSRFYQALTGTLVVWWLLEQILGVAVMGFLGHVLEQVPKIANLRIGFAGLALIILVGSWAVILLFKAYRETRPYERLDELEERNHLLQAEVQTLSKYKPAEATPSPLSAYELNAIEAARTFWAATGNAATGTLEWGLLRPVQMELGKTTRLTYLLTEPLNELVEARESLTSAVRDHAQVPLAAVQGRLDRVFKAYIRAARYVHECQESHGVRLDVEPFGDKYERWTRLHHRFEKNLRALVLRSDYAAIRFEVSQEDNWKLRFRELDHHL